MPDTEVLLIKLYGVHTAATLSAWRAEIGAVWGQHCRAYVIDYSRAMLAAAPDELSDLQVDSFATKPSAIVGTDAQMPAMHAHCAAILSRGVLRMPFAEVQSAVQWAQVAAQTRFAGPETVEAPSAQRAPHRACVPAG